MAAFYLEKALQFYEVSVKGNNLHIRYGRPKQRGTSKTKSFESAQQTKLAAATLIQKKIRSGFKLRNDAPTGDAPVLWTFQTEDSALGLHVDDHRCWVGDEAGNVFALDHRPKVLARYQFDEPVKALVGDHHWIYAGTDSGQVFDLSRKVPTVAYEVKQHEKVYWMAIWGGVLCISDAAGRCTLFDHEGDRLWSRKGPTREAWMIRADKRGLFHGTGWTAGPGCLTHYDWKGQKLWAQKTIGGVGFGWLEPSKVFVSTIKGVVHTYSRQGVPGPICHCDDEVLSCATSPKGERIFVGDGSGFLYGFDKRGKRLWKFRSTAGHPQSMQYHKDRLYIVTNQKLLVCFDVSEKAIDLAIAGKRPRVKKIRLPKSKGQRIGGQLKTVPKNAKGVRLICRKEGGRLHVYPVSKAYNKQWKVQFPRDIREEGALFLVDDLVVSKRGGFYRALGEIRRVRK